MQRIARVRLAAFVGLSLAVVGLIHVLSWQSVLDRHAITQAVLRSASPSACSA
jgi:hypothetical protein